MRDLAPRRELRVLGALGGVLAAVAAPSLTVALVLGVVPLCILSRHPGALARYGRRLFALLPLIVVAALSAVRAHPSAAPTNPLWISAFDLELPDAAALTAARIGVAALFLSALTESVSPVELEHALGRLRVPAALVELTSLTRRFTSQLGDTLASARAAAVLRGGFTSARAFGRTVGLVAGVVVLRAVIRSDRVAVALALRGGS